MRLMGMFEGSCSVLHNLNGVAAIFKK